MFKINPETLISNTDKLLYDIRELLIKLCENDKPEPKEESKKQTNVHKCKICGKEYDNIGKMLACARRHKKEGKE